MTEKYEVGTTYIVASVYSESIAYLLYDVYTCQEVIFDKDKGTVSLMNSRFFEKHILGYRRLSEWQYNLIGDKYCDIHIPTVTQ